MCRPRWPFGLPDPLGHLGHSPVVGRALLLLRMFEMSPMPPPPPPPPLLLLVDVAGFFLGRPALFLTIVQRAHPLHPIALSLSGLSATGALFFRRSSPFFLGGARVRAA